MEIDWSLIAVVVLIVAGLGFRFGPAIWAKVKPSPRQKACPTIHQVVDAYAVLLAALDARGEREAAETLHEKILPAALPGPSSVEVGQ